MWRRSALGIAWVIAVCGSLSVSTVSASAKPPETPHCISPVGEDLNVIFGTEDALVAPFCSEIRIGDRWRALLRIVVAGSDPVFPPGYAPQSSDLIEDFLTKLVSVRMVVDAGTRQERTFSFPADSLLLQIGTLPDGTEFVRLATPSIHPLPPGTHTLDQYVTLSADFWDGLGLDPAVNFIPEDESLAVPLELTVVKRH